jgi:hypothetical protein
MEQSRVKRGEKDIPVPSTTTSYSFAISSIFDACVAKEKRKEVWENVWSVKVSGLSLWLEVWRG